MAGPTPVPFEGVFVLFYFSGNGHSSVRIVHLTGEHFDIINIYFLLTKKKMIKFCIYYYSEKIRKDKIRANYDDEDFKIFLLKPMSDPRGN